ncbi:MAG TPA: anthranilate phosphoribosyltransferase, partial [Limnochordales bacterium]
MNLREAIARLVEGHDLEEPEAEAAMGTIMAGEATPAQIGAFLVALRMKGETPAEVAGCARALRRSALAVKASTARPVLDTCGPGGDRSFTINISTAAAIIAAAAGIPVAKHGNRSVSSRSGSADVLEALGVPLALTPEQAARCLERAGIAFLFAPAFHPAMRHAQGPRRELEIRTIFNLLGPLANPAGAPVQLLGVYHPSAVDLVAEALLRLGTQRALVVCGREGLDELSPAGPSVAAWVEPQGIRRFEVRPEDAGLDPAPLESIRGGSAQENAQ